MTKTELFNRVMEILQENKVKKAVVEELTELLKPKKSGGVSLYPMISKDGENYYYCRYSGIYVVESEIVLSNGKSKGYSKKGISLWTKLGKNIQALNDEAMKLLLDGDSEAGRLKADEAETLKIERNKTDLYFEVKQEYLDLALGFEVGE